MNKINLKNKSGFTLVELMVAIAVFSIVMVTATSALLNVIDANAKARSIKTAINNLSLALEGISKDMRMGTDYMCGESMDSISNGTTDCTDGVTVIGYKSPRSFEGSKNVYYKFNEAEGILEECLEDGEFDDCKSGVTDFDPITSREMDITAVKFYVIGVANSPLPAGRGKTQPRMVMTLSGTAGKGKDKTQTEFDLQTSVSQRIRPEDNP